jgi:hypothetical protein
MRRPIIVTGYNSNIDPLVVSYQKMVVDKLRGDIPFFSYDYTGSDMLHGDVCNKLIHKLFYEYQEGADCILFLDIDCIPLSKEAIEWTFEQAYNGILVGNAQRSNHYKNDQHVYAVISYCCFTRETFEKAGSPTMSFSKKYDVSELLTVNCGEKNIPVNLLMPKHSESPNQDGEYWNLADGMPKYGIGTTFSNGVMDISYHLFCSRFNKYSKLFYDKCHSIIMEN